ncbi:MAG: acyl-CoA dehydrogenase [Actinomycetia bacterium]|nr:acyl-CoA dehydrogenase [Actinomycetes bacterium]
MASLDDLLEELGAWLAENWSPDLTVRQWWARAGAAGWLFPTWPEGLGGRALTAAEGRAVAAEMVDAGALGPPFSLGQVMGGPVVLQNGTPEQQARLVPALANGTEAWCQFFSEPEAGSDLAGLRTTAIRDGDEWIVNGQKVWTSDARRADRGMLVARTNWDVPKHRGLGYFIIDVDQPGIEIRPLRQMNGAAHFNEVFFTDARVSHENLIGGEGDGWGSAVATLAFERAGLSSRVPGQVIAQPGEKGAMLDRKAGDLVAAPVPAAVGNRALRSSTEIAALAREAGKLDDPNIRQGLAQLEMMGQTANWAGQRARAAAKSGQQPGPFANLAKLAGSDIGKVARDLAPRTLGPSGMLRGSDAPRNGAIADMVLSQPASSIAGGTDEIQRNIIAERGLGLPKDIQVDRDMPFKEVPKSG